MRRLLILLLSMTLLLNSYLSEVEAGELYYFETFTNYATYTQNGWNPDYRYGRDGVFYPSTIWYGNDPGNTSKVTTVNGRLEITGRANTCDLAYNNYWVGRTTKFVPENCPNINKQINATAEQPFGIQVVRYFANIDTDWQDRSLQGYMRDTLNIWLIKHQPSKTNEWDTLDNFVYFMEAVYRQYTWGVNNESSRFGFYTGSDNFPDVTSLTCANGYTHSFDTATWHWQYNDRYYGDTAEGQNDNGGGIITNSLQHLLTARNPNTNRLGIRITHDGTYIRFYLNPNPDDTQGPDPNSYFLLGQVQVGWSDDLAIMFGHENLYFCTESEEAQYDNFLIRSVASNVVAEVSPSQVKRSNSINFTMELKGSFSSNESGIGEFKVKKPSAYGNWNYGSITVYTNDVALTQVTMDTNPNQGQVSLSTNTAGDELKVRFNKTSGANNDIINYFHNATIRLSFTLDVPSALDATGKDFDVYVNNEKYPDTGADITLTAGGIKYATTGWQKATEGDAGTTVDTSSLNVKVFGDPQCYAGITYTPQPVYEDNTGLQSYTYYYEFSTTGISDAPDISRVYINIPTGFIVSNTNVTSSGIQDDNNNIKVSNNQIIVNYYSDVIGKIVSPNGYDRIEIQAYGTPDLPLNTLYTDYTWTSEVSSVDFVVGSSNQSTTTNSTYPSQDVRVILQSPDIIGSVDLTNGLNLPRVSTETPTNRFKYTILNDGTTKVFKVKIQLPGIFTNAFDFDSDILGTNVSYVQSSNLIYLDYIGTNTNISPSSTDELRMTLVHNRTISSPYTNPPVRCYGENGNTEGYVLGQPSTVPGWAIEVVPPDPTGQSSIETNIIYTTISGVYDTNVIYYTIYNNGAVGNNLAKAEIVIPSAFEIVNVLSSHISNDATRISNVANTIYLNYDTDTKGVLKSYLETASEKDIVTLILRHQITSPTSFVISNQVKNVSKTNYQETTAYPSETKTLTIEYPHVKAKCYAEVDADPVNNIIDSATETNALTYYITNIGKTGNQILTAIVNVPTAMSTNLLNITSTQISNDGSYITYDNSTGNMRLNYQQDTHPLLGGQKDVITFTMVDHVVGETSYSLDTDASNSRETSSLDAPSGKQKNIFFDIPDADAGSALVNKYVYTNTSPVLDSFMIKVTNRGRGSNNVKKIRILFPNIFTNKVYAVRSSYLGTSSPQAYYTIADNYIEVLYETAGLDLVSSATDFIRLSFTNSFADTNTVTWAVEVDNGDGNNYVPTSTITNLTKRMEIIMPADVNISPSSTFIISTNITFTYTIRNGKVQKARTIYNARITVPSAFSMADLNTFSDTWSSSVLSTNGNILLLDYSANPLTAGAQDIITLNFQQVNTSETTNAPFPCEVNYNYIDGYRSTAVINGNTNSVAVIIPPGAAQAYGTPNSVGKDISDSPYSVVVRNSGQSGNKIYQVKITPPNFVTNITSMTSQIIGGNIQLTNNVIFLKYHSYSTNLSSSQEDTISFIGYDNVNSVTQGSWVVTVNNTTNITGFTQATIYNPYSLDLSLYQPTYKAYSFVTPLTLDTTALTNRVVININNVSSDSSKLNKLKIFIPQEFRSNNLQISNTKSADLSYDNNAIIINYSISNSQLDVDESDTVVLRIEDKISLGNTNSVWITAANYSSSGSLYITNDINPGNNITNQLIMPQPIYGRAYNVSEIYNTTGQFKTILRITNKGQGSHEIKYVTIAVPSVFTNGFSIGDISSTGASNIVKNYNTVQLYYTNYQPQTVDQITLDLNNTNRSTAGFNLNIVLSNNFNSSSENLPVNVRVPASASISPQSIDSTSVSNQFSLLIKNDGSGSKQLDIVKVIVPDIITNIKNISSSKMDGYNYNGQILYLYYTNNPILNTQNDTVTFMAIDSITLLETNVQLSVMLSNDFGLSSVSYNSTNNLRITYSVPDISANAYIYDPTWVTTTASNNFVSIKVTNKAVDLNDLRRIVINFPSGLTIYSNAVTSTHIADTNYIQLGNNSKITLYYNLDGNGSIKANETDLIRIPARHAFAVETNLEITVIADNGLHFTNIGPGINQTLSLEVKYPDDYSYNYISSPSIIYTLDTNASINFYVENNSYDNRITDLYFNLNTNIFELQSVNAYYSNTYTFYSNYLRVQFASGIPTRTSDNIVLNVKYSCSSNMHFMFTNYAVFEGSMVWYQLNVPNGKTNGLPLSYSDFGRVKGLIKPTGVSATVEVLNNDQNVYNKFGQIVTASINPTDGSYTVDFVPAGTYKLKFTSDEYRTTYYEGVVVSENQYTSVSNVKLRNKIFNDDAVANQRATDEDDLSYVDFPPGSILEDFYLDIYRSTPDQKQGTGINKCDTIIKPQNATVLRLYYFLMQDKNENTVEELKIDATVTIVLYYTDAEIAAQGWAESTLAVYYYKKNTGDWVKLGGKVDTAKNTITLQVSYLHDYYGIFGSTKGKVVKFTEGFKCWPNPFSPGRGGDAYENMKISFGFTTPVEKFSFKVYDLNGRFLYSKDYFGSFTQGEIYWDGKDDQGHILKSGIYIYQIETGNEYYRGKVMILK